MKNALVKKFTILSKRDQRAVIILSVFLLVTFTYFAIIKPSANYYEQAKSYYSDSISELSLLNKFKSDYGDLAGVTTISNELTSQDITNLAKSKGISISRIEQISNSIEARIDSAPFNQIIMFLDDIEKQNNAEITKIIIDKNKEEGMVNVIISLRI